MRKLCDKYGIPIACDETLTGEGRTGKFFAYEHYPDFLPDFVIFGKGLIVNGIAFQPRMEQQKKVRDYFTMKNFSSVTNITTPQPILQCCQVLQRILEGKLMDNIAQVGFYFICTVTGAGQSIRLFRKKQDERNRWINMDFATYRTENSIK